MCLKTETRYICGHSYDSVIEECEEVKNGKPCLFSEIVDFQRSRQRCFECNTPESN